MIDEPLHARSVAEAYLYLMATPCEKCAGGPLRSAGKRDMTEFERGTLAIESKCDACTHRREYAFDLPEGIAADPDRDDLYPVINPTELSSNILDVSQWITLFRVILEAASTEANKVEARRLGYEAAQCIEEAIKFYEDNELPPKSAFFHDATRAHLRDHPQQFAKQRLLDLRAKLPQTTTMRTHVTRDARADHPHRPWWRFWN